MKVNPSIKKINKPVLICVQPTIKYFAWQVEVMLTNFRSLGIHNRFDVHILFAYNDRLPTVQNDLSWGKAVEATFPEYSFFYYDDTREDIVYISSVRPHILKKHFKAYPDLSRRAIFYHDCDIIFTKFPDFIIELSEDDDKWYVSDTKSYIGYNYIVSKGLDVLQEMCRVVGINEEVVRSREDQSGGAQYIMKGVDWMFFEKVERDCDQLFRRISALSGLKRSTDPNYHDLQIWCADMWAVLWNAWMRGYTTQVIPEMDFCWATDPVERFDERYIFHNAGVTQETRHTHFYKAEHVGSVPYGIDNKYDQTKASFRYYTLMKSVKDSILPAKEICDNLLSTFNDSQKPSEVSTAMARIGTCIKCEEFNNETGNYFCTKCGCTTRSKIFSGDKNGCPLSKWEI